MKYSTVFYIAFFAFLCSSCYQKPEVSIGIREHALFPQPREVKPSIESFVLDHETTITINPNDSLDFESQELAAYFNKITARALPIKFSKDKLVSNTIHLSIDTTLTGVSLKEGYELIINKERVTVKALENDGIYRGLQTLKQLLPLEGLTSNDWKGVVWALPGVTIVDEPTYSYRGAMLDVARHFFSVQDVKRYIDLLSLYKINKLHLHLADDQGWRIEIKSWPKLTEIGGSTAVGGGKGGFYSQEDYKEIIAYALERHITVIPEIDMPGHTNAALASYPELNCNNVSPKLYTGMQVGFSSLCVGKEITYTFIEDVIRELAQITPGAYIHLGGDESHATSKTDYNKFLKRVFTIVSKYDKKVMGWEDIQSAGLNSSMIVQHWTNKETAQKGAQQGAQVVLSPAPYTYLDMKYNDSTKLGLTWAGVIDVEKSYNWDPSKTLDASINAQIIGIESPLWAETIETIEDIEYMTFPRIIAHASLGWKGNPMQDASNFEQDIYEHLKWLDGFEVNYKK